DARGARRHRLDGHEPESARGTDRAVGGHAAITERDAAVGEDHTATTGGAEVGCIRAVAAGPDGVGSGQLGRRCVAPSQRRRYDDEKREAVHGEMSAAPRKPGTGASRSSDTSKESVPSGA